MHPAVYKKRTLLQLLDASHKSLARSVSRRLRSAVTSALRRVRRGGGIQPDAHQVVANAITFHNVHKAYAVHAIRNTRNRSLHEAVRATAMKEVAAL